MEKRVPSEDILSVFVMCYKNKSAMKGIHSLPVIKLYRIHRGQELVFFCEFHTFKCERVCGLGRFNFSSTLHHCHTMEQRQIISFKHVFDEDYDFNANHELDMNFKSKYHFAWTKLEMLNFRS